MLEGCIILCFGLCLIVGRTVASEEANEWQERLLGSRLSVRVMAMAFLIVGAIFVAVGAAMIADEVVR